jgi:hypothetical protein
MRSAIPPGIELANLGMWDSLILMMLVASASAVDSQV